VRDPLEPYSHRGPSENASKVIVARQPICRQSSSVFAYEILYRNEFLEKAAVTNADEATAGVLVKTFMEIGLERLVGKTPAFLNVTRQFLLSDYCFILPKGRVVLEVLEDIEPEDQVVRALTKLRKRGYSIALDDFCFSEDKRPLLQVADYVKIDFRAETPSTLVQQIPILKEFKVKLLAEKVETHEEFELAKALGFDYFQGYFFCRPKIVTAARIPLNKISALRLIMRLQDPNLSIANLERIINQDVALSFRLLRYVNSALLSLTSRIESLSHAIQMVGTRRIRSWASIIMLTTLDDKPVELMITAVVRAAMAERLATALNIAKKDSCFTVGLFSVVDALLDLPMPKALDLLPFSDDVKQALTDGTGPLGFIPKCILAYERGNWSEVNCRGLDLRTISQCYLDSIIEARDLFEPFNA
jgi:EAL and modified HD-GYP domain-containing signal transduction protein